MIVDDHVLFAEAIRVSLEDAGVEVVAVVGTGEEGISTAVHAKPDVILMDLGLPDQSGLAAGRAILDAWPDAKILALTALSDHAAVDEALRIGFRGYLTKDTSVTRFVNSVRSVLDGHVVLPHSLSPSGRRAHIGDDAVLLAAQLTARERQVLELLVEGADGRTVASRLGISRNTVRTHVQSILTKLQVHSRLEAATFAVRNGLVDVPRAANGYAGAYRESSGV